MSIRDRLYERKFAWHIKQVASYPAKRIASVGDGRGYLRLYSGTESKHRLDAARKINCLQRLKLDRS